MAKQLFLVLLFCGWGLMVAAQPSNFVLFSEKSEPFTLVLNGQQVNTAPALNLKVTGLQSAQYQMRVIFNNPSLPEFRDVVIINPGNEVTYALTYATVGRTEMRFVNEFSLVYRPLPPQNQQVVAYTGPVTFNPPPGTVNPTTAPNGGTFNPPPTGTNPNVGQSGGSVSLDVNVGGQASDIQPVPGEVTTTTTTTTIIEETAGGGAVVGSNGPPNPLPGYTGAVGCDGPMPRVEFSEAKTSIDSKSFSDSKMRVAKQIARTNCLLSSQVKDIMGLFSFETDKLEFAKFAYDFTYDIGNYYQVNDAFTFEGSIDELEQYLSGR
ncbi:MAG: DUF4476 domain-containing protein [Bacteroidota bacterium]